MHSTNATAHVAGLAILLSLVACGVEEIDGSEAAVGKADTVADLVAKLPPLEAEWGFFEGEVSSPTEERALPDMTEGDKKTVEISAKGAFRVLAKIKNLPSAGRPDLELSLSNDDGVLQVARLGHDWAQGELLVWGPQDKTDYELVVEHLRAGRHASRVEVLVKVEALQFAAGQVERKEPFEIATLPPDERHDLRIEAKGAFELVVEAADSWATEQPNLEIEVINTDDGSKWWRNPSGARWHQLRRVVFGPPDRKVSYDVRLHNLAGSEDRPLRVRAVPIAPLRGAVHSPVYLQHLGAHRAYQTYGFQVEAKGAFQVVLGDEAGPRTYLPVVLVKAPDGTISAEGGGVGRQLRHFVWGDDELRTYTVDVTSSYRYFSGTLPLRVMPLPASPAPVVLRDRIEGEPVYSRLGTDEAGCTACDLRRERCLVELYQDELYVSCTERDATCREGTWQQVLGDDGKGCNMFRRCEAGDKWSKPQQLPQKVDREWGDPFALTQQLLGDLFGKEALQCSEKKPSDEVAEFATWLKETETKPRPHLEPRLHLTYQRDGLVRLRAEVCNTGEVTARYGWLDLEVATGHARCYAGCNETVYLLGVDASDNCHSWPVELYFDEPGSYDVSLDAEWSADGEQYGETYEKRIEVEPPEPGEPRLYLHFPKPWARDGQAHYTIEVCNSGGPSGHMNVALVRDAGERPGCHPREVIEQWPLDGLPRAGDNCWEWREAIDTAEGDHKVWLVADSDCELGDKPVVRFQSFTVDEDEEIGSAFNKKNKASSTDDKRSDNDKDDKKDDDKADRDGEDQSDGDDGGCRLGGRGDAPLPLLSLLLLGVLWGRRRPGKIR